MEYTSKGTKKTKDSNNEKKKLDKFYTNDKAVDGLLDVLIDLLKQHNVDINQFTFLEPCAGGGAFLNGISRSSIVPKDIISYDIEPEDSRITKANFLEVSPNYSCSTISVGNPPFGYKGDLAVSFINRCGKWGPMIAFVLPIQFRRFNIQKHVDSAFKLIYSSDDLPKKSFLLNGKPYNVNCMYQIWVNRDFAPFKKDKDLRMLKPLPNKHPDFKLFIHNNTQETLKYFDKTKYKWDFAVYRQGFYDYSVKITNEKQLEKHIQYLFVKFESDVSKKVFENMDFVKLSHTNTSILGFSNTDVVAEYIKIKKTMGYSEDESGSEQMQLFD